MPMQNPSENDSTSQSVVSNRTMNIVVALVLMVVAAIVMVESYRLGAGWAQDVGPDSGYFPFYIGLFLFVSSAITCAQSLRIPAGEGGTFVTRHALAMVLKVLIPMTVFVVLSTIIGIYVSTFLFICYFMMMLGGYSLLAAIPVGVAVPIALFVVFEHYFLVPLPKGPLEAWLGF